MKEKLCKFLDLKTIITLVVIATLSFLVLSGREVEEKLFLLFSNITTSVVTFYFNKVVGKSSEKDNNKDKQIS